MGGIGKIIRTVAGESKNSFLRRTKRMIKNAEIHGKKTGNYDPMHAAQSYHDSMLDEFGDAWDAGKRARPPSYSEWTGGGTTRGRDDVHIPDYIGRRRAARGVGVAALGVGLANNNGPMMGFDEGKRRK